MKSIFLKQSKPLTVSILGISMLVLTVFLTIEGSAELTQLVTMLFIVLVLLGYSISFEFRDSLEHKRHFKMFGVTLFKQSLVSIVPEYITVFSALFKQGSEWGPVSALGGQRDSGNYVIRFFKGNAHFTIWKTKSLTQANTKAKEVGSLLNVEVRLRD
ncbi:MAG: hypothetical protein AB8B59_12005 [Maribacter sp.]